MKRILSVLLLVCIWMLAAVPAMAAGLPTVSFAAAEGAINGGFAYDLVVRVNQPQTADLPVQIKNGATGEVFTVVIPAGEKQAAYAVDTDAVDTRAKISFSILKSEMYKGNGRHALTVQPLPRVTFAGKIYMGAMGRNASVKMKCSNAACIVKGNNTFQLRNSEGVVLAEKAWPAGAKEASFTVAVDESTLGRHDLTLWLGEHCLTEQPGYASFADTSRKAVQRLAPEVPLMAIGIDCAYDDSKTDAILEVLEKHQVKVTFFMTGQFMRTFPEAAKKIAAAGHEIANHSNTHRHMKTLGAYEQYRQVMHPVEEAEEMLGVTPRLFRPPFGEFNAQISSQCRGEGMEVVMWTMSYCDSAKIYPYDKMIRYATTGADYGPGAIVLCHLDGAYMPDTLEAGLSYYESLGLQVVPISALIYASGGELPPMPAAREALVYSDEYWPAWLRENVPEHAWVLDK